MNGNEFLDKLEHINSEFIEAADNIPKHKKYTKIKWITIAAGFCIILTSAFFAANYFNLFGGKETHKKVVSAAGFNLNDNDDVLYFPISFDERVRYGLVPEDALGLTEENTYRITKSDIGEPIGTVTSCGDTALIGCKAYRFAKFPDYDSICIVDIGGEYKFYTGTIFIGKYFNLSSNECLAKYNLPNSLKKFEIIDDEFNVMYEIKDEKTISSFFGIISDKEDIGSNELNRKRADAWYREYGNDDLYYDEASGEIVYKNANQIIKEGYTSSFEDGTEIIYEPQFPDTETRDKAAELWNRNCVNILLTGNNGFSITVEYEPITSTFGISNSNFSLTVEEVKILNSLFKITE